MVHLLLQGEGHGTDRAIIAGLLGMKPDDLRIPVAFEEAKKAGMEFTIANRELKNAHPNTARVVMENAEGRKMVLQAYSIGGGRIRVSILDGIEVDFSGESNTLIVRNMDRPGCITEVSAALSREKINVATMQVFRHKRGGAAVMVVETDEPIPVACNGRTAEERRYSGSYFPQSGDWNCRTRGQIRKFMRRDSESFCQPVHVIVWEITKMAVRLGKGGRNNGISGSGGNTGQM